MKHKIFFMIALVTLFCMSCTKMFDNVEKYAGETVYPAGFDTIVARMGFERVEIDLLRINFVKDSKGKMVLGKRVNSKHIKLGKASKTIVEYDGKVQMELDSVVSWVNVKGLSESKIYRFKIYTKDIYGNISIPKQIDLIPFTAGDANAIAVATPKITITPANFAAEWPNGLSSSVARYIGLKYSYTDKDGVKKGNEITGSRFFCSNLSPESDVVVGITYNFRPILNGVSLLDSVFISRNLELKMPSSSTPFSPSERIFLEANGITTFTAAGVSAYKKLVLPLHVSTLSDLLYFPNLEELDLTGDGLQNILSTQVFSGSGRNFSSGGGKWEPFMRRIEYTNVLKAEIKSVETLKDLLETGQIKKVRYIKNSMNLDEIFETYKAKGTLTLDYVPESWFPNEIQVPTRFLHDGMYVTGAFSVRIKVLDNGRAPQFYESSAHFRPDNNPERTFLAPGDIPAGSFLFPDDIFKAEPWQYDRDPVTGKPTNDQGRNAMFSFTLPRGYMFDFDRYRYVKFKVWIRGDVNELKDNGDKTNVIDATGGAYRGYRIMWPRIRYTNWGPDQPNNPYGDGDNWEWKPGWKSGNNNDFARYTIPNANINSGWTEFTIDTGDLNNLDTQASDPSLKGRIMNQQHNRGDLLPAGFWDRNNRYDQYHNRTICINMGGERGINPNPHFPNTKIWYYFADFRLSKTP